MRGSGIFKTIQRYHFFASRAPNLFKNAHNQEMSIRTGCGQMIGSSGVETPERYDFA
jgi:hypothetical protein